MPAAEQQVEELASPRARRSVGSDRGSRARSQPLNTRQMPRARASPHAGYEGRRSDRAGDPRRQAAAEQDLGGVALAQRLVAPGRGRPRSVRRAAARNAGDRAHARGSRARSRCVERGEVARHQRERPRRSPRRSTAQGCCGRSAVPRARRSGFRGSASARAQVDLLGERADIVISERARRVEHRAADPHLGRRRVESLRRPVRQLVGRRRARR